MTPHDGYSTLCGGANAVVHGTGVVAGSMMTATYTRIACANGAKPPLPPLVTYTYDPATKTIAESLGNTFYRPGSRGRLLGRAGVPGPPI